ncbi:MAG: hypothetical protein RBT20_13280 [Syntrophales bacterium]|nr:hypothetical protein [Syntrophales bacterium]
MRDIFMIIVFIVGMLAAVFFIQNFLVKRALKQVIEIFRRYGALQAGNAKTLEELGLGPKSFITKMASLRDYKPDALKLLIQRDVIMSTDEGKLYLKEERLAGVFKEKL